MHQANTRMVTGVMQVFDWRVEMKIWKNTLQIVTALTVGVAASSAVQAREFREDPAAASAVLTQEIIDLIYQSSGMPAAQAPRLAELCPILAANS